MIIPEKYRERYDALARSHPWMREMRDEQPPEGDAVEFMRELAHVAIVTQVNERLNTVCLGDSLDKLSDMVERDYISRDAYDKLASEDAWIIMKLEAERELYRDNMLAQADRVAELEAEIAKRDKGIERLKRRRDELTDEVKRLEAELKRGQK